MEVLKSLLNTGAERDEAKEYILGLAGVVNSGKQFSETRNLAIDSIINYKLNKGRENNTEITLNISIPRDLKTEASDMVIILGNLLYNAIHG